MILTLVKHDAWNTWRAFRNPKNAEALYFESTKNERADPANARWAVDDEEWIRWGVEENGNWMWDEAVIPEDEERLIEIHRLATELSGALPAAGRYDWFVEAIGQLFEQLGVDDTPEEERVYIEDAIEPEESPDWNLDRPI